jgi:CubicO group peptidase (beta-lactamase class C family)
MWKEVSRKMIWRKLESTVLIGLIMSLCMCANRDGEKQVDTSIEKVIMEQVNPTEVGMSTELVKQAENLFVDAVEQDKVLGYQLIVARNGKIVLDVAGGYRDLENKLSMERNTLLRMASNTKSVTAIGVLKLVDQGLISLQDSISKYLGGFEADPANKITVEQLLLHQSGYMNFAPFVGGLTPDPDSPDKSPTLEYEAYKLGQEGPEVQPGSMFRYSNRGYNILAALIEKVSGQKLPKFMEENLFEPLGMTQTSYKLWGVDSTRVAKQYWFTKGAWEKLDVWEVEFPRGSAGITSNASDFIKFGQMLLNKGKYGHHRILNESTVIKATSALIEVPEAYLPLEIEQEMGFESEWYEYRDPRDLDIDKYRGYGFVVSDKGVFSHAGIFGTFMYVDPERDLVAVILAQSIYGGNPGQQFIELINDAIVE